MSFAVPFYLYIHTIVFLYPKGLLKIWEVFTKNIQTEYMKGVVNIFIHRRDFRNYDNTITTRQAASQAGQGVCLQERDSCYALCIHHDYS